MFYLFCIFKRQNMRNQKVLLRILFLQDSIRDAQNIFLFFFFCAENKKSLFTKSFSSANLLSKLQNKNG